MEVSGGRVRSATLEIECGDGATCWGLCEQHWNDIVKRLGGCLRIGVVSALILPTPSPKGRQWTT